MAKFHTILFFFFFHFNRLCIQERFVFVFLMQWYMLIVTQSYLFIIQFEILLFQTQYLFNSFIGYIYKLKMNTYTRTETKNGQTYAKESIVLCCTPKKGQKKKKFKQLKPENVQQSIVFTNVFFILSFYFFFIFSFSF